MFLRRRIRLFFWLVVPSFCMVVGLSPTVAGTNGTTSIDMHARKGASLSTKGRNDDGQSRFVILGASLEEWTQRFWTRFMSIPLNVSPATDLTGINCGINQAGPVWFLAAPIGGPNTISCTIPAGKVILAPAATYMNDYPCPDPNPGPGAGQSLEDFLTQGATPIIDSVTSTVELDGHPLKLHRVTAGLQSFTGAKDIVSLDQCVTGSPQLGVADGQYALIGPLSPGLHTLHIHFDSPILGSSDNTFHLTIK